jgi:hypothetical protein
MKTLIVYTKDSFYKYPDLFTLHCYEITEDKILKVSRRDLTTGEERENAVFKEWDYFVIEEGNND